MRERPAETEALQERARKERVNRAAPVIPEVQDRMKKATRDSLLKGADKTRERSRRRAILMSTGTDS